MKIFAPLIKSKTHCICLEEYVIKHTIWGTIWQITEFFFPEEKTGAGRHSGLWTKGRQKQDCLCADQ